MRIDGIEKLGEATNVDRAAYARVALAAYAEVSGSTLASVGENVVDLISDLLHLVDQGDEDMDYTVDEALETAKNHFEVEVSS